MMWFLGRTNPGAELTTFSRIVIGHLTCIVHGYEKFAPLADH
jgi:hypothetical protein